MGGINCSKCGKWVGKDGYLDIVWDDYNGGWEMGYPLCGPCLKKQTENEQRDSANKTSQGVLEKPYQWIRKNCPFLPRL